MIAELLRYAASRYCHRDSHALGFQRMGIGIQFRATRHRDAWRSHLENCKRVQGQWISEAAIPKNGRIIVLGAGRLFDVDLALLSLNFSEICFVDADPLCVRFWRKAKKRFPKVRFRFELLEISGKLNTWRDSLQHFVTKHPLQEARKYFHALAKDSSAEACDSPFISLVKDFRPHAVLSLNVLSQIPVMWKDCVERTLSEAYGREAVQAAETMWMEAHMASARGLVRQHMSELGKSGAQELLLLSDAEYIHYPASLAVGQSDTEPPVKWQPALATGDRPAAVSGNWMIRNTTATSSGAMGTVGSAATPVLELTDALYGVNIENPRLRETLLPGWNSIGFDPWLWNLVPAGAEGNGDGIVNRVIAYRFFQNQSARND